MPISEKIIQKINEIDEEEKFKNLMKDLLLLEDDGAKRWTKQYEGKIKEYLGIDEEAKD